jgi:hypothetical protein
MTYLGFCKNISNVFIYYGVLFIGISVLILFSILNYPSLLMNDDLRIVICYYLVYYVIIFICIIHIKHTLDVTRKMKIYNFGNDYANLIKTSVYMIDSRNVEENNILIETNLSSPNVNYYKYLTEFNGLYIIKYRSNLIFNLMVGYLFGVVIAYIRFENANVLTSHSKAYKIHMLCQNIFIVVLAFINNFIIEYKIDKISLKIINCCNKDLNRV